MNENERDGMMKLVCVRGRENYEKFESERDGMRKRCGYVAPV